MKEAKLFNTNLSLISLSEMSETLVTSSNKSVAVCNANSVVRGNRSNRLGRVLNGLDYKVCDGYPLSKALNILYKTNQERVDGYNLFLSTIEHGLDKNTSHFFYGNTPFVVEKMIKELKNKYNEINISGYHCPPMLEIEELTDINNVEIIDNSNSDIVWVSLGFPKQEQFMQYVMDNKKNSFNILGVGNVFDWVAKTKYKAPEIFANNGFEWLFRFFQEPIRLSRRYFIDNTLFMLFFIKQYFLR
ncbi:MAG: hypothetical protein CMA27_05480 [Euryarchaeota archaeon]|nr:hypothetical protein [Euryarchaeota archaeon]|tara:strand:- start:2944 stop:3678 length:735 start_codon:yes stop_codon:yes gene_type:complete